MDLVAKLEPAEKLIAEARLTSISPDDGKYYGSSKDLIRYLSAEAEWRACAFIQKLLLETRKEFGQAEQKHVDEVTAALTQISPLNMSLLEEQVTKHDQLAVLEEIGRFVSPETKALLHPGTTSYDILDTARAYLLKNAWYDVIRNKITEAIHYLADLGEKYIDLIQVGRTHLQYTSPVSFGGQFAIAAATLAERVQTADSSFDKLKGKISGIVGTGSSVEAVIGEGKALEFESRVLEKLNLDPDITATQITNRAVFAEIGNSAVLLSLSLGKVCDDIRQLNSSDIEEIVLEATRARRGGSSADAGKKNPINFENICGKAAVVEGGMRALYASIDTDFQRDLRNSVQARYQPGQMLVEVYESFVRFVRAIKEVKPNETKISEHLIRVRNEPTEAMTAITRAHGYVHPELGVGHDFVKYCAKLSQERGKKLLEVALEDPHFKDFYNMEFSVKEKAILGGELELYLGAAKEKARKNIIRAREL